MNSLNKFLFLSLIFACGCSKYETQNPQSELVSINIIDHNGFSEAISSKDRLENYKKTDFLNSQPYQKVLRVYSRRPDGLIPAYITSYYPSGQLRQYLEILNHRASGVYKEWNSNGTLKLEVNVIGGQADLSIAAEKTWIFDGTATAYNELSQKVAEIPYSKGEIEGVATYYYPNGCVWKEASFQKNKLDGLSKEFYPDGNLKSLQTYAAGKKSGSQQTFWKDSSEQSTEMYREGLLENGTYFNSSGTLVAKVDLGKGMRGIFDDKNLIQLEEYNLGHPEGSVQVYENGILKKEYYLKNGLKNGEEIIYSSRSSHRKILSIHWVDGSVQGIVKTWYENGVLESQRELCLNKKNGTSYAWYNDGSIMMIEEYSQDCLVNGEYFKKGDLFPSSRVISGKGCASLFNPDGIFLRKVNYIDGKVIS